MLNSFGCRMLALARGFMHSRIFLTAIELGLFRALGTETRDAPALARRVGADPRALEVLLNALTAMGLIEKCEGGFRNTPLAWEALKTDDGADFDAFLNDVRLWDRWSDLTAVVRGRRPERPAPCPELERAAALAMRQHAQPSAEAFARTFDGAPFRRLLDLGGGAGVFALALAAHNPQLRALIMDSSEAALTIARSDIAAKGLADRVTTRLGDVMTDDLGDGHDLALISSVLCLLSEDENRALLARARDAMAAGGRIVIRDAILEPTGIAPPQFAVFSVHMLVCTERGCAYTRAQIARWLAEAGFADIQHMPVQDARLVLARKPA